MADPTTKALVYRQLPDTVKKLTKWYSSREVTDVDLLNLLASGLRHPHHVRLICDVTVDYLRRMGAHCHPDVLRRVLRQHSYLARRLHSEAGHEQYQINVLCWFLTAAYPDKLSRQDVYHVMIGTKEPPIPVFLAAVLLMLAEPADAPLARELYAFSSIMTMQIDVKTLRELEKLLLIASPQHEEDASQA